MTQRMDPKERRAQILDVAVRLARTHGANNITRPMVAEAIGITPGAIHVYFKGIDKLREAVKQKIRRGTKK